MTNQGRGYKKCVKTSTDLIFGRDIRPTEKIGGVGEGDDQTRGNKRSVNIPTDQTRGRWGGGRREGV